MKNESTAKTWHQKHLDELTSGQHIADKTASAIGSWPFIIIQSILVTVWITINLIAFVKRWDPYPFVLLNLLFSVQAAYSAPIIMMSQNRQNERDRRQALEDYETNVKAKEEVEELKRALTKIENEKLDKILELLRSAGTKV
ncbi:MAG: DUF1003 domain-containing protein [Candidatus Paceibacterota bacterium]